MSLSRAWKISSRSVAAISRRLGKTLTAGIGIDELMLVLGLVLITVALWPLLQRTALVVPGAAMTWMALPSRSRFICRPDPIIRRRKDEH